MIVTLTLNPCIDLNLEIEDFSFTHPLRALRERRRAGGKGINVAATLHVLGADATAAVLLGGATGREFRELCEHDPRYGLRFVEVASNTRTNIVITSRQNPRQLKVNQQGGEVSSDEFKRIAYLLTTLLRAGDYLVLAGNLPTGVPADTYADFIRDFHARGCRIALDTDLAAFREGVKACPDLIKPNREELERLIDAKLTSEKQILDVCRALVETSCRICLVTDGPRPAYLVTKLHSFRGLPSPATGSPVGAGDACLAGMVKMLSTIDRQHPSGEEPAEEILREGFRLALSCGSAAASMPDTEYFTRDVLDEFLGKVRIEKVA